MIGRQDLGGGDGDETRAGPERPDGRQLSGAGLAHRPRDDEHMTVAAFV